MNLRNFSAFEHLNADQEARLLGATRQLAFADGDHIRSEEGDLHTAYVVVRGAVQVRRETAMGALTLSRLEPGGIFGETSFLDTGARSVVSVAEGDTSLLVLDRDALAAVIAEDPIFEVALYWAFWRSLSGKLRETNRLLLRFFEEGTDDVPPREATPAEPVHVELAKRREALRSLKLSNMEVNFFASLAEAQRLDPHQKLFRTGDRADHMYVVVSGRVMVSQHIPGAGEEALTFLEAGDLFGEMGLIDRVPRCADVGATEEGAVILAIRGEVLSKVLNPDKPSSIRLLKTLCALVSKRVRDTNEKLVGWFLLAGGKIPGEAP